MTETTKAVRATLTPAVDGTPLHAGPVFAAPFHASGIPAATQYTYGRSHNPTWTDLERAIAILEGGDGIEVRTFASGLAAVAAVFGAVLKSGDVVVVPANAYFAARQLLDEKFAPMGVSVRRVQHAEMTSAEAVRGARLVWLETPSNPRMEITDIVAACEVAHRAGALVAVDNTTATPLGQRPLELGADFSVCSDSKMMSGMSDILLGHVGVRDAGLLALLDRQRTLTGAVPGPMESWILLRSLPTLALRLERSSANALEIAEFLLGRPEVSGVTYPGIGAGSGLTGSKTDTERVVADTVAGRQMQFFGGVLGFDLGSAEAADLFLQACELVTEATSFGGITTTAERRRRWGHDEVGEGFIRMSVGCEDVGDLIGDLGRALDLGRAG